MKKVSVLLAMNTPKAYDYSISDSLDVKLGDFVKVPFRNREIMGIIWDKSLEGIEQSKLKEVIEYYPTYKLSNNIINFIKFFSRYNYTFLGRVLKLFIPHPYLIEKGKTSLKYKINKEIPYKITKTKARKSVLELFEAGNKVLSSAEMTNYFIKRINNTIKIEKSVIKQKKEEIRYGLNKKNAYFRFKKRVQESKKRLVSIFNYCKSKNKKIIGYGATAKSTTILNYCNINDQTIDYFLDTTKDKQNKYTPGTKIKINQYKGGIKEDVDYVFLGAWNFKKEIFKKEKKYIKAGGKFIIHTPYPKII